VGVKVEKMPKSEKSLYDFFNFFLHFFEQSGTCCIFLDSSWVGLSEKAHMGKNAPLFFSICQKMKKIEM
jgi:hypothetical protein